MTEPKRIYIHLSGLLYKREYRRLGNNAPGKFLNDFLGFIEPKGYLFAGGVHLESEKEANDCLQEKWKEEKVPRARKGAQAKRRTRIRTKAEKRGKPIPRKK